MFYKIVFCVRKYDTERPYHREIVAESETGADPEFTNNDNHVLLIPWLQKFVTNGYISQVLTVVTVPDKEARLAGYYCYSKF